MLKTISLVTCFILLPYVMISVNYFNSYHFFTVTGLVSGLVVAHGGMQVRSLDDRGLMKQ